MQTIPIEKIVLSIHHTKHSISKAILKVGLKFGVFPLAILVMEIPELKASDRGDSCNIWRIIL